MLEHVARRVEKRKKHGGCKKGERGSEKEGKEERWRERSVPRETSISLPRGTPGRALCSTAAQFQPIWPKVGRNFIFTRLQPPPTRTVCGSFVRRQHQPYTISTSNSSFEPATVLSAYSYRTSGEMDLTREGS